jgi:hypothetical protein
MKVSFRTVSGESFQLDAEASTTIGGLKDLLVEARSIQRDAMKLVYRYFMNSSSVICAVMRSLYNG